MTMKLKLDENNNVVVKDGMPVYVHADGKEIPFDANKATVKIAELNGEAKQHREAKEAVEAKLKAFEGIADPKAAIKALETVKNLDDKKLIDAGEVEKVKAEMRKTFDEQLAESKSHAEKLQSQLHAELIGGSFARSKYAAEHLNLPSDVCKPSSVSISVFQMKVKWWRSSPMAMKFTAVHAQVKKPILRKH